MRKLFLLGALMLGPAAGAQSPVLHHFRPLGIPAGQTTEVKVAGERLGQITGVWCGTPNVGVVPTNDARLIITVPTNAAGLIALRVATTNGITDVATLMIDSMPAQEESATN